MNYKITATLGPSSRTALIWEKMLSAGVSGFRLNTSHLSIARLGSWLESMETFLASVPSRPPLVLDLQGSKWRLGDFPPFELSPGNSVELQFASTTKNPNILPVPHPDFFAAALVSSTTIVLNDAKIQLLMEEAKDQWIKAKVVRGGPIFPQKGITFAASEYRKETLNEKDQSILEIGRHYPSIQYAISYVKDEAEMQRYRRLVGDQIYLIAKLERRQAVLEALKISKHVDELWLCRGDLGAEIGMQAMAEAVHGFSGTVKGCLLPIYMAGQLFEHMTKHADPTRSEVCYLYDILQRGYAGVVLSDETAIGDFPVESCRTAAMYR